MFSGGRIGDSGQYASLGVQQPLGCSSMVAARLEQLCPPAGVLVSGTVRRGDPAAGPAEFVDWLVDSV